MIATSRVQAYKITALVTEECILSSKAALTRSSSLPWQRTRGSAVRRAVLLRSLPEDGHRSPTETPEALLLGKLTKSQKIQQQQQQQLEQLEQQQNSAAMELQELRQRARSRSSSSDRGSGGSSSGNGRASESDALLAPAGGTPRRRLMLPQLGLEVTPELVAISMVYFVQGILGLSRLALSFFFKDDLGVEPAQVAVLTGLAGLPWVVKPLYGFISDAVPLWGYRRRSYLMLCGLAGSLSWLVLAGGVKSPGGAVAAMLLGSLSTACADVVVDSLVVERARGEPAATAGSLQSLCWASSALGGVASAYWSGSLVGSIGARGVFGITALFPLVVSASAMLIDEQRVVLTPGGSSGRGGGRQRRQNSGVSGLAATGSALAAALATQGAALWGAIRQRHILLPTVFVFLWQATPSADSTMFYYYTNELHFTPEFLGRVRLAGSLASLAGVALYNGVFKTVPLKRMLMGAMLLGAALSSTQLLLVSGANKSLGLSNELFVLGDSVILTVLGQVSFMPILVLAARMCPEGVEATLFATLMSILNGGAFVGSAFGAGLTSVLGVTSTEFENLFVLLALCSASTLLPAPFLWLLPSSLDDDDRSGGSAGANSSSSSSSKGTGGTRTGLKPAAVRVADEEAGPLRPTTPGSSRARHGSED